MRALSCASLVVLLAWAPAAAREASRSDEMDLARQLRARGLDPDDVVWPHAVDEEMVRWVEDRLPRSCSEEQRLEALLEILLQRDELALEYHQGSTGTAIQTFRSRRANCLAFTHLFVGLARHLGLPVYYLRVDDFESFERDGDLIVVAGHVTAGFGSLANPHVLEFSLFPAAEHRRMRYLSDLAAVALFYSNRGAELLLEDRPEEALHWLETAVRIEPRLVEAWVNLGVARRRAGADEGAETAYRRALAIDPESTSAYRNLGTLLLLTEGREEEGRRLLALIDRRENRNPFAFLLLGDLSLEAGRLGDAESYYRRALELDSDSAAVKAAIGQWFLAADRPRKARKWLRRARQVDPAADRVIRLARALDSGRRAGGA